MKNNNPNNHLPPVPVPIKVIAPSSPEPTVPEKVPSRTRGAKNTILIQTPVKLKYY